MSARQSFAAKIAAVAVVLSVLLVGSSVHGWFWIPASRSTPCDEGMLAVRGSAGSVLHYYVLEHSLDHARDEGRLRRCPQLHHPHARH